VTHRASDVQHGYASRRFSKKPFNFHAIYVLSYRAVRYVAYTNTSSDRATFSKPGVCVSAYHFTRPLLPARGVHYTRVEIVPIACISSRGLLLLLFFFIACARGVIKKHYVTACFAGQSSGSRAARLLNEGESDPARQTTFICYSTLHRTPPHPPTRASRQYALCCFHPSRILVCTYRVFRRRRTPPRRIYTVLPPGLAVWGRYFLCAPQIVRLYRPRQYKYSRPSVIRSKRSVPRKSRGNSTENNVHLGALGNRE